MIFTKHATLFLVSTFGILAVTDGGSSTRTKRGLKSSKGSKSHGHGPGPMNPPNLIDRQSGGFFDVTNPCIDSNPDTPSALCFVNGVVNAMVGPQTGINITEGYEGGFTRFRDFPPPDDPDAEGDIVEPITESYLEANLCPVNIHWHSGAEHFSAGEFDCTGRDCAPNNRPTGGRQLSKYGLMNDEEDVHAADETTHRELDDDDPPRDGFRCNFYDKQDHRFTTNYDFKYCKKMMVGETYEVHWPHGSAVGIGNGSWAQCGTPNQYQTPFYRGLFCNFARQDLSFPEVVGNGAGQVNYQAVANSFAVQGQVFTIINDEEYYYPDLFRGMIRGFKDFGKDMAVYIGSSSESQHTNEVCSSYSPITWQVDRKCHLISASSFDKLCADMLSQSPTNMMADVEPGGARELVADALADPRVETLDQTPWEN